MSFYEQSRVARQRVQQISGARVVPIGQLPAVWSKLSKLDLDNFVLLLVNRQERNIDGRKTSEMVMQVDFEPAAFSLLLKTLARLKEQNPLGVPDQVTIQKLLGGSDPGDLETMENIREAAKMRPTERLSVLEWVALVPKNTSGLHQLLAEMTAFSLTEQRHMWKSHKKQVGGAFFPYCLNPITDENGRWTDDYFNWVMLVKNELYHFGVPGIPEMLETELHEHGMRPGIEEKEYHVKDTWEMMPHCAIMALREAEYKQPTDEQRERLHVVINSLLTNRMFITQEKVPINKITQEFKKRNWPVVIMRKEWRSAKQQWDTRYMPDGKKKKEALAKTDCVIIKVGLFNEEHYFYWREDVNEEFKVSLWPESIKQIFARQTTRMLSNGEVINVATIPACSSGLMMKKLIDCGLLRRFTQKEELKYPKFQIAPNRTLVQQFEFLNSLSEDEFNEMCVFDTTHNLNKKLGLGKIDRESLFVGDTEAFIDPKTGEHIPSMLIVKGLYHDSRFHHYIWEEGDVIGSVMKEIFTAQAKKILERIKNSDCEDKNWETIKRRILQFNANEYSPAKFKKILKEFKLSDKKVDPQIAFLSRPIIYFHHLGYDIQPFLKRFKPATKDRFAIKKGAVWYKAAFRYKGWDFELRNSLTIITAPLRAFPAMFLPKEEQSKMIKEVYAYKAINNRLLDFAEDDERIFENFVVSQENFKFAIQAFETGKSENEKEQLFNEIWETAAKIGVRTEDRIDIGKYAEYYCERDVDLLAIGLKAWANIGEQDTQKSTFKGMPPFDKFDVFNFLSAPGIAQAVTEAKVRDGFDDDDLETLENHCKVLKPGVNPEEATYKYKGILRQFMLNATTGGRCTLPNEQKVHVDCSSQPLIQNVLKKLSEGLNLNEEESSNAFDHLIQDFDARSLYPTAMSKAFIPYGRPKRVKFLPYRDESFIRNNENLPDDAFYIITEIKYGKRLAMPCNCYKQKKPEPRCRWTNEIPETEIQLRKLTDLKTMIEVQDAHFKVVGGLEWRHGKCTKIQQFMPDVYAFRVLNHSNGFNHPIQESAKLIMNSFYGKNVTKLREFEETFIPKMNIQYLKDEGWTEIEGVDIVFDTVKKNFCNIKQITSCGGCWVIKQRCKDDSAYDVNFGCEVLAGARALICRVSAAIETITGQPCLYTDTDSLHVFGWQIKAIENWFQEKFKLPLIGPNLGQFHPDFEPKKFKKGEKCLGSSLFIGVGKKMYLDKLVGDQGSSEYHRRAKGVRAEWITEEEYEALYKGATIVKDIDACGGVNIRAKDGSNFSIHMVKIVRATADGEMQVDVELRDMSNTELEEDGIGGVQEKQRETDEEDIMQIEKRAEKRGREQVEGNESDTEELLSEENGDENLNSNKKIRIV